jgi:hypothetical protein
MQNVEIKEKLIYNFLDKMAGTELVCEPVVTRVTHGGGLYRVVSNNDYFILEFVLDPTHNVTASFTSVELRNLISLFFCLDNKTSSGYIKKWVKKRKNIKNIGDIKTKAIRL